jgi:hypothetical protein
MMAAIPDFVFPETRGERPVDLEERLRFAGVLSRVAARDAAVQRLVIEVWHMFGPRNAYQDPMNLDELRMLLRRRCDKAGSVRAWALKHGVSPVYVGNVLAGKRGPGKALLDALGLVRVISYIERK